MKAAAKIRTISPAKKESRQASPELTDKSKRLSEARDKAREASKLAVLNWPKPEDVAKLVPSSGQNLMVCPSYFPFEREDQDMSAADEGTLLHEACASRDSSTLSPEQARLVDMCLEYSKDLEEGAFSVVKEAKAEIKGVSNGYIDLLILRQDKKEVHVIDYKFGKSPVADASQNFQGWMYVMWAFDKFELAETVTVHFLCPRINEITVHCFFRQDVAFIRKAVGEIQLSLTMSPSQRPHRVDPLVCSRCARAYSCPALTSLAESVVSYYDPENLENLSGELKFLRCRPSEITDTERMAKAFVVMKALENWCGSVKEHTKQWLLAGNEMDDYGVELGSKDGSKKIKDEDVPLLFHKLVEEKKLILPEKFFAACSVGVTELLNAYAEGKENATKAKAELLSILTAEGALIYGTPSYYAQISKDIKKKIKKKE